MALRRNLLAQSVINGLVVAFPVHSIPNPRCVVQACPPAEVAPEPDPDPEPTAFSALLASLVIDAGIGTSITPYAANSTTGIGAAAPGDYDLTAAGLVWDTTNTPASYGPGLMLVIDQVDPLTQQALALEVTAGGVAPTTGGLLFTPVSTIRMAYASPTQFYALGGEIGGQNLTVKVGEITAGAVSEVGSLTLSADPTLSYQVYGACMLDGHLCAAVRDASGTGSQAYLRSFSFDGTTVAAVDVQNVTATAYSLSNTKAGPDYMALKHNGTEDTDFYTYTAAGGFALAFSADLSALAAGFTEVYIRLIDSVTGYLWLALTNAGYDTFRVGVYEVGPTGLTEIALIPVSEELFYSFSGVHADVIVHQDATYTDTVLSVRTGATLTALAGTQPLQTPVFLPLTGV